MGFLGQSSVAKQIPATLLLPGFQLHGTFQYFGLMQTFLNDEQKGVFTLLENVIYGLETGNPATSLSIPEVYVRKDQSQVIAFEGALPQDETGLLPRTAAIAAYTSHYVIQGQFHMAPDALLSDYFDTPKPLFVGVSDATIFPLFRPQAGLIQNAPLAFVYRKAVRMHHRM